jgi:hypothetical protein
MKEKDRSEDLIPGKGPLDDYGVRTGRYLLAAILVAAAVGRCFAPQEVANRLDWQFVLIIVAAGALLLLPYLSKVTFGKGGGSLTFGTASDRKAVETYGVGGKKSGTGTRSLLPRKIAEPLRELIEKVTSAKIAGPDETRALEKLDAVASDDPQKGQWGGKQEWDNYRLSANVTRIQDSPDLFSLELKVTYLGKNHGLGKRVRFHLHPTFRKSEVDVPIDNDEATLHLVAWGAFTVGVEVFDQGGERITTLELDLSTLPDVPREFRDR